METPEKTSELDNMKGAFVGSLVRNNKKIREDRAIAIAESAEMLYKRKVEDTELQIKQLKRDREAMLMSLPTLASTDYETALNLLNIMERRLDMALEDAQVLGGQRAPDQPPAPAADPADPLGIRRPRR